MKKFRRKFRLLHFLLGLFMLLGLSLFTVTCLAQTAQIAIGGTGSGTGGTTNSYFVASVYSTSGGAPTITYINGKSDKAGSKLQFYTSSTAQGFNNTNVTTSLACVSTNGVSAGTIIVLHHVSTDTYDELWVSSVGLTNIVTTVAPSATVTTGDSYFVQTAAGSIPWGASTNAVGPAQYIYAGAPGLPLLMALDSTSGGQGIQAVGGVYLH